MPFLLAHVSDPHLAPLPQPQLIELIGKRVTGYINWRRKRAAIHQAEVLARIVADLKAQRPDHIAVTGDLVNLALPSEYLQARAWLDALGSPTDVTLVPGNHDAYVRSGVAASQTHWGDFMRGDTAAAAASEFPFLRRRGPLALIGVSTSVPSPPFMAIGRVGPGQLQRLEKILDASGRDGLYPRRPHPPSADQQALALSQAPHRWAASARRAGAARRRAGDPRPQPPSPDRLARRTERAHPAIGVPSASEAPPGEHDPAGYNLYRIEGTSGAWRCEVITRGMTSDGVAEIDRTMLKSS